MSTFTFDKTKLQARIIDSGFFLIALLFHLIIFLMVATLVIFKAPEQPADNATFASIAVRTPPPPAPPPPAGGEAMNHLEPSLTVTPPAAAPTTISTVSPSFFHVKVDMPAVTALPPSMLAASGTAMQGHDAPGEMAGAGSPFGHVQSDGNTGLQGFLYDLKQTDDRKPTDMTPGNYHKQVKEFIEANWSQGILDKYYKSPKPLSTSSIFVPTINADDGPKAFGVEKEVQPKMYVVWYKVTASPSQAGTYHFVGTADDIMLVKVNGKTVLDASDLVVDSELRKRQKSYPWTNFTPTCGGDSMAWVGLPFQVQAADSVDIDILIGEEPGGRSNYFLYIQREENTYQNQTNGSPLLPVFQLDTILIKPVGSPGSFPPFSPTIESWTTVNK